MASCLAAADGVPDWMAESRVTFRGNPGLA